MFTFLKGNKLIRFLEISICFSFEIIILLDVVTLIHDRNNFRLFFAIHSSTIVKRAKTTNLKLLFIFHIRLTTTI